MTHQQIIDDMKGCFCEERWDEIQRQWNEGLITGGEMFWKMVYVWCNWAYPNIQ